MEEEASTEIFLKIAAIKRNQQRNDFAIFVAMPHGKV
jgi:hypothetical protein